MGDFKTVAVLEEGIVKCEVQIRDDKAVWLHFYKDGKQVSDMIWNALGLPGVVTMTTSDLKMRKIRVIE